jgi:hypothetical protein
VLDPAAKHAFEMNKNARVTLSRGTFVVNSKSNQAVKVENTSHLRTWVRGEVVGDIEGGKGKHGSIEPPPDTNADPVPDPLASIDKPPCPPALQAQGPGTAEHPVEYHPGDGAVLCPGVYYGGIKIDHHGSVTFDTCGMPPDQAVFVMADHGLHVHGSALTAKGVMIYNTTKNWCVKPDHGCGSLHFDQKASVDLSPPTSGEYEGLAVFQDPACNKQFNLSGQALSGVEGEIYLPKAQLTIKGKGSKKKGTTTGAIKASFVVNKFRIGNMSVVDDPDEESDGEMEDMLAGDPDPDFKLDASTGASTRRVVLSE